MLPGNKGFVGPFAIQGPLRLFEKQCMAVTVNISNQRVIASGISSSPSCYLYGKDNVYVLDLIIINIQSNNSARAIPRPRIPSRVKRCKAVYRESSLGAGNKDRGRGHIWTKLRRSQS